MRCDGAYKTYKLYSITEQDIAEAGGAGASRYVNNTVLVFLPDIEKPEIGTELLVADSIKSAQNMIDEIESKNKTASHEIFAVAVLKSMEMERERKAQESKFNRDNEERRKEEMQI